MLGGAGVENDGNESAADGAVGEPPLHDAAAIAATMGTYERMLGASR